MPSLNKKFELSPRLKLAVGRRYSQNQILKFSTFFCLFLTILLAGNAVRLIVRSKSSSNQVQPQVLGATSAQTVSSSDQLQFIEYKIKKGDTLFDISQQYNIDWMTLATLNDLKSPFSLQPGQTLKIPKK